MGFLTREMILAVDDRKPVPVDCPEWGGTVFVRSMSGREKDALETSWRDDKGKFQQRDFRAKFVAMIACDEKGNRLFSEMDVELLTQKSTIALDRLIDAANKLNGMGVAAVEDAEKNLQKDQSGDSILH